MVTKRKITKKKPKRKVAGRAAPKKRMPGWIILLIGMLSGLSMAVVAYINDWVPKPDHPTNEPIEQTKKAEKTNKIEDKSEELKIKPKKDYDFYKTLQEMEVVVEDSELTQVNDRESQPYVLQLGAFRHKEDAEALKAQVAFTGLTVFIQGVDVNKEHWYRVRTEPYESGRKADVALRNLGKNGFEAIIIKQNK